MATIQASKPVETRVPGFEPSRPALQLRAGDPLRAVAALSVLAYHVVTITPGGDAPPASHYGGVAGPLLGSLNLGLHMFFALTGYLLGRPFLHAFLMGTRGPSIRRYLRNRALRILPAFWLLTTLSLVVLGPAGASIKQIAAMYGLMQLWVPSDASERLAPAWSLQPEAIFYVVLPIGFLIAVMLAGHRLQRSGRGRMVALVLGAIWLGGLAVLVVGPPIAYTVCAFVPGLALAAIELWAPQQLAQRPEFGRKLAGCMAGVSVLPLVGYAFVSGAAPRAVFASLAILLLLASVLVRQWSDGGAWRTLDNRVLHWLGVRAYSIYLIHFFVILQINEHVGGHNAVARASIVALLTVPITVAAAALSFRWFEQPFLARRAQPS